MKKPTVDELEEGNSSPSGPDSGGQSGDLQGIGDTEGSSSESVEELLEEGQYFEASILSGIENAPLADAGEIRTREVLQDDVPEEYLEEDRKAAGQG